MAEDDCDWAWIFDVGVGYGVLGMGCWVCGYKTTNEKRKKRKKRNENGAQTRQIPPNGQTNRQDRHQRLVRHRIHNRPQHRLQPPAPRHPSVHEIGDAGVGEERHRPGVLVVHD